jgi:hypothetical protein
MAANHCLLSGSVLFAPAKPLPTPVLQAARCWQPLVANTCAYKSIAAKDDYG